MTPAVLLGATRPRPAARRVEPAFVAGLAQYGDHTALVAGDDRLTYRELDAAAYDRWLDSDEPRVGHDDLDAAEAGAEAEFGA